VLSGLGSDFDSDQALKLRRAHFLILILFFILIIVFLVVGRPGAGIKKPTAVSSRGFLSKFVLPTTSTLGVAEYDDYQQNFLSNVP
jgi:hypothetical protein